MAEETEEEKKARLAREQLSLRDVSGLWSTFTDMVGTVFNWGIPALLLGGILLAAAGPISSLIRQFNPEWADKFLEYTDMAKLWINKSIGKRVFDVDPAREQEIIRSQATPEVVQGMFSEQLGSPELAKLIVPNQQAVDEILGFMQESGIPPTDAKRMMEPANMLAFVRKNPQVMQRVVDALPAGAAGVAAISKMAMPHVQKLLGANGDALIAAIGNMNSANAQDPQARKVMADSLRTLLTFMEQNPGHKAWIDSAVNKFAEPGIAALYTKLQAEPQAMQGLIAQIEQGKSLPEAVASLTQSGQISGTLQQDIVELAYTKMKADTVLGPVLTAIEAKDPALTAELKALLAKTTDEKQIGAEALKLITAKQERILALKDLSEEQVTALMGKLGLTPEGSNAVLFSHKPTRDAAIDMIAKLAKTNTEKNELGEMLGAMMGAQGQLARIGILAGYTQGNQDRLGAIHEFKLALDTIAATRGDDVKPAYATAAAMITGLVGNAPQATELAKASEKLPDALKPIIEETLSQGPVYLSHLMTSDAGRAILAGETDGRKNLYHLGDAIASMDAAKFGASASMLQMLATKRGEAYPNLEALVQMANTIDAHTGVDVKTSRTVAGIAEDKRTDNDKAIAQREDDADKLNRDMLGVFAAMASGTIKQKGAANGAATLYEVEAFGEKYNVTGNGIAAYFNSKSPEGVTPQTVTALVQFLNAADTSKLTAEQQVAFGAFKEHLWVDANKNGVIEPAEGAANFLYKPDYADKLLATAATGTNQFAGYLSTIFSTGLSLSTGGLFAKPMEATDGKHLEAISEALVKAGVGKTNETHTASGPDPIRLALQGVIPGGMSPSS